MENYTINQSQILELASELAHNATQSTLSIVDSSEMFIEDENGNQVYTEEAQDEFNQQYDYYLTMIENILK